MKIHMKKAIFPLLTPNPVMWNKDPQQTSFSTQLILVSSPLAFLLDFLASLLLAMLAVGISCFSQIQAELGLFIYNLHNACVSHRKHYEFRWATLIKVSTLHILALDFWCAFAYLKAKTTRSRSTVRSPFVFQTLLHFFI